MKDLLYELSKIEKNYLRSKAFGCYDDENL
jgi:hypothetical protein